MKTGLFGWDPWGDLFNSLVDAAANMLQFTITTMLDIAQVDFSSEWFREVYSGTMWLAIVVWAVLILFAILAYVRGRLAAGEMIETVTSRTLLFFVGMLFGPMVGQLLGSAVAKLSGGILGWSVGYAAGDVAANAGESFRTIDTEGFLFGRQVGIVLVFGVCVALLGCMMGVLVAGFLQYVLGAMFPLIIVFAASAKHRHIAKRGLTVIGGLLLVPLFMAIFLAIVFRMIGSANMNNGGPDSPAWALVHGPDTARDVWFVMTALVGLVAACIVPFLITISLGKMGMGAVSSVSRLGSTSAGASPSSTAGAATFATGASGKAASGAAAGAVVGSAVPGAGTAAGAAAGAGKGAAASGVASTAQASQASSQAARASTGGQRFGSAVEQGARQASTSAHRGTTNTAMASNMAASNEEEGRDHG